jgi:hypothetical protein
MATVEKDIARLDTLASDELRREWRRLTATPLPRISPSLLRVALAWEIQARAFGGLSRTTQQKLDQISAGKTKTSAAAPGTRLVREWDGKLHVVTIDEQKVIDWNDRSWNSLSEVARAITGTRWSGPAFFGLKKKAAAA